MHADALNGMWFGTEQKMMWIPIPLVGAGTSPSGWGSSGTLMNGGAFTVQSFDTHQRDIFTWSDASSQEFVQDMVAYSQGVYGRGLIHYINPRLYRHNILPAKWAAPYLNTTQGVASICRGVTPVAVPNESGYGPPMGARFDIPNGPRGLITLSSKDPVPGALVIPLPPNTTFRWSFNYTSDGSTSGIYYRYKGVGDPDSGYSNWVRTTTTTGWNQLSGTASGRVVQFAVGKTINGAASLTINSMRMILDSHDPHFTNPPENYDEWLPGRGHSGMRFEPGTLATSMNSYTNRGQNSLSASFIEVGSWL